MRLKALGFGLDICLVAELMHFITFWENITHYKTESVHFWGLMNSATKLQHLLQSPK